MKLSGLVQSRHIPGVLLQTAPPRRATPESAKIGAGTFELIDLDLSRYDALTPMLVAAQKDAIDFLKSGIATRNAAFNHLIEEIEQVAVRSRAPILLTGPTGAGKSMLARRMYELKKARHLAHGAFVDVNCATLHGDGAGSALFGHKKGAFTGAQVDRAGLLKTAHGGVLFLDEIGELGLDEQAMLLKAIEEKRFFPVGSDLEVESNFQLIAGTNLDLRQAVQSGRFREDLFARINLWSYVLPGLAHRREDIEPNIDHLLNTVSMELQRQVRFNAEARAAYLSFAQSAEATWRGNFRDLSASVTRMATLADNGRIDTDIVHAELTRLRWLWTDKQTTSRHQVIDLQALLGEKAVQIDEFDALQLQVVLHICQQCNNLSEAGRRLFQVSRTERSVVNDADRLRKYLQRFGLTWETCRR